MGLHEYPAADIGNSVMKTPIAAFMVSLCPCVATVAERPDSTLNSMKIRHAVLLTMMLAITSSLQSQTMACYARSGNEKKQTTAFQTREWPCRGSWYEAPDDNTEKERDND